MFEVMLSSNCVGSNSMQKEIQTKEYGFGLDGILKIRSEDLFYVILNPG